MCVCVCVAQITVRDGMNYVEQQLVNCLDEGDCYYTGSVSITSLTGDVTITVADWDRTTLIDVSCVA